MSENFKGLFTNRIFRIPDYQRGFSWQERQLVDLWEDIADIQFNNETQEYEKHYTGTIFLEKKPISIIPKNETWLKGVSHFHVVDGQQRLTCLEILIFCLIQFNDSDYCGEGMDKIKETFILQKNSSRNSSIYKFSYEGYSADFLCNVIFEDNDVVVADKKTTLYTRNLIYAKEFFQKKLRELTKQEREIIYQKVVSSLQFDVREMTSDFDVQTVFETMNNRGKPLTILEKLKNRLFFLCDRVSSGEDRDTLRKTINDSWAKIYFSLAKNPNNVLSEDEFVSAHLTLYRTPVADYTVFSFSEEAAEKKLFEMFCNHPERFKKGLEIEGPEPAISFEKINDYTLSVSDFVELWYRVNNSDDLIINKILLLNNTKEIKIFLCLVLKFYDETVSKSILDSVERILFRKRTFVWDNFDERYFSNIARELFNRTKTIEDVKNELSSVISDEINVNQICDSFSQLFDYVRGNKGFHRWTALKYVLFEYEEQLMLEAHETNRRVNLSDYSNTTIEHIIPQHYESWWKDEVYDFTSPFPENEKEQAQKVLINSLGNLTILKNGKNASVKDNPWKTQGCIVGKRERYRTGSYNEIEISKVEKWDKNAILERGIRIIDLIFKKLNGSSVPVETKQIVLFYKDSYFMKGFNRIQQLMNETE